MARENMMRGQKMGERGGQKQKKSKEKRGMKKEGGMMGERGGGVSY